jgi:hypothetical protein
MAGESACKCEDLSSNPRTHHHQKKKKKRRRIRRLRQSDYKFKTNLGYIMRSSLKEKKTKGFL